MWLRQMTDNAQGLPRERHPRQLIFQQSSYRILPIGLHKLCCCSYNKQYRLIAANVLTADSHSPDQQKSLQLPEPSSVEDNLHSKSESIIPIVIAETSQQTQGEGLAIMPATAASLPVPLGIHVDAATKSKIWSNQFVDLSFLLSRQASQSFQIQLQENQLIMTPRKKV